MDTTQPATDERTAQALQMRAMTIQFLKALEDELIASGVLTADDRACLTRADRRARDNATIPVDNRPLSGV